MMKKTVIYIIILYSFLNTVCIGKTSINNTAINNVNTSNYETTMKQDILCLMMAYPEYITDIKRETNGSVYLIMKSGRKILYDDRRIKNAEETLHNPDLEDMMKQIYPLTSTMKLMATDIDPGRARVYSLLEEVYGGSRQKVEGNLKNVNIIYRKYQFNEKNKAASSLQAAIKELEPLSKQRKDIRESIFPCGGTFNYRTIAGTNRLSPHSFGIAIDLARDERDYWRWASLKQGQDRLSTYPEDIVEIFERNNFIWGGKWAHFDILHFEYRPEIILKAKYFKNKDSFCESWHDSKYFEDASVKNYINKIDTLLK